MLTVIKAAIAIILFFPTAASAVQATGSIYSIVGFSLEDRVLLQHQHVQHGVTYFEVWNSADGKLLAKHNVSAEQVVDKLRAQLMQEHSIVSPGYIGPLAPDRSAAVIVLPLPQEDAASFNIEIEMYDGKGTRAISKIPIQTACPTPNSPHARVHAIWSPNSRTALLVGAVIGESPCGFSNATPVALFAPTTGGITTRTLSSISTKIRTRLKSIRTNHPADGAYLATQLLAIFPDDAATLVTLAELRALSGDLRGALAALWRLPVVKQGRQVLKQAMKADWLAALKEKAHFQALDWYLQAP